MNREQEIDDAWSIYNEFLSVEAWYYQRYWE